MRKLSEPVFLTYEEVEKYKKDDKYGLDICQCPIPIYLPDGENVHIVEYDKPYTCAKCGTKMMLCKGPGPY
jgi:hypothetical protein